MLNLKILIKGLCLTIVFQPVFSQPEIKYRLDSLSREYDKLHFHGVVLVARGDSILYHGSYGYADLGKKTRLTPTTLFKMESTGKMFTAVSIMQLVEKGKLQLTQTVKELLPGLAIKNADRITVHHLLNHRSGLQSPWDHPDFSFKKVYSRSEMEKIITGIPLIFDEPGKEMFYSNSGYIILSWIIEKVTGFSFDNYLEAQIFHPGKMNRIRHLDDTLMPPSEAQPYKVLNSKKYIPSNETVGPKASGAGGWIGTANDLYRFMLGLDKNIFIKPSTMEIMRTANHSNPRDSIYRYYSYGLENFVNQTIKGVSYYGHSGGGAGFSIDAIVDPVSHYIIIFCNNTGIDARQISANYLRVALGKPANKIVLPNPIRIYDTIEAIGINEFVKNEKEIFQSMGITPNPRLFINIGEAMETAKDYATMASWMELGATYFPDDGFLQLVTGNAYSNLGEKEKSVNKYEIAKTIAVKNNDQRMLSELKKKLKGQQGE
jgi:CubicO group peptidase (beta-lactamase class C family)